MNSNFKRRLQVTNTRTLRTAITLLVIVAIWSTTAIAQNWLRGWKYGAKTVTVPYSVADLEYGKTLKLRIDSERDRISPIKSRTIP